MFASNVTLSPRARAYMKGHPGLFETLAADNVWYLKSAAILIDVPVDDRAFDHMGARCLPYLAARLRGIACDQRCREDGMASDVRAGGGDPTRCFVEFAERIEAYVAEKGIVPPVLFETTVLPGASEAETEWARAVIGTMQGHALLMTACELVDRPSWQHGPILEAVGRLGAALKGPFDAATVLYQLDDLLDYGVSDMFRVLIRHGAGFPDPQGIKPEEALACAATRRALAEAGAMPRVALDATTAMALALPVTRDAVAALALSFNAWLDEDHGRWARPEGFPFRIPVRASAEADLVDLGLAERVRGKLRLTKLGAEATQLKPAADEAAVS